MSPKSPKITKGYINQRVGKVYKELGTRLFDLDGYVETLRHDVKVLQQQRQLTRKVEDRPNLIFDLLTEVRNYRALLVAGCAGGDKVNSLNQLIEEAEYALESDR